MKKFHLFIVLLTLPFHLFSQGKITHKLSETWNPDAAKWDLNVEETWEYDAQRREVFFTHENTLYSDFTPYNHQSTQTAYQENGAPIKVINLGWNDSMWTKAQIDYQYANNRIQEYLAIYSDSYNEDEITASKAIYNYNDLNDNRTFTVFENDGNLEDWIFSYERDSFFNASGCLEKEVITNTSNVRWGTRTYDGDCRPLSYNYWFGDGDSMTLLHRTLYDYSANGRITNSIYQKLNVQTQEWMAIHFSIIEVDEKDRVIRKEYEAFTGNADKTIVLDSYTDQDELATHHEYKRLTIDGVDMLQLNRQDSFVYQYSLENKLEKKELYSGYQNTIFPKITTFYEYYCDGQLKKETIEQLPSISRITYEYDKSGDCDLAKEALQLTIYPNPTSGKTLIQSNLFSNSNAVIRVFSTFGKEIYTEKVTHLTDQYQLDLTHLPNGSYIVFIADGDINISKKVLILK